MSRVLFVTWDGGGNVPPALGIAGELARRGDAVRFLGHPRQRELIERHGFPFEEYQRARDWSAIENLSSRAAPLAYAAVFADRGMGDDLVASLDREPADRVVIDGLLIGAMSKAAHAGIGYSVLVHTLYGVMDKALNRGPLGVILRLKGLRPSRLYRSAEVVVVVTLETLDPAATTTLPTSVRYTGPIVPAAQPAAPDGGDPVVLVSLSTTFIDGQRDTLQEILAAVDGLPLRAVVTTGPALDPDGLRVPANAELHRYLPHAEVMGSASLVVGHGGHATTMLALAHDLPMLILPMVEGFDQPTIGRVLADHGAAEVLSKKATSREVREVIQRLLASDSYRSSAARLGTLIRARQGAAVAADALAVDLSGSVR